MKRLIATLVVGGMMVFGAAPAGAGPDRASEFRSKCADFGLAVAQTAATSGDFGDFIRNTVLGLAPGDVDDTFAPAHGGCPQEPV